MRLGKTGCRMRRMMQRRWIGVQREGKHLGTGKAVENKRALGLGLEVFRCLGCLWVLRPDERVGPKRLCDNPHRRSLLDLPDIDKAIAFE